ncbi:MAG: hypothetical protein N4A71_22025 [Carboxylicivirga sp.]|jgi:uncharacterized lipoprotein YajG|nr:hypothetical protein [Carboxylicivirga sp.]
MRTNWNNIAVAMLVAMLVMTGCKTVKETIQVQTDTEAIQNNDVQIATDSVSQVEVNDVLEDKTELSDSLVVNEVTVVLSKPDSTGKQYPKRITYKETTKVNNTKKDVRQLKDSVQSTDFKQLLTDKTDSKSSTLVAIDSKTKIKKPNPFMWPLLLLSVGVLIFAYLILKRFGFIK